MPNGCPRKGRIFAATGKGPGFKDIKEQGANGGEPISRGAGLTRWTSGKSTNK